MKQFEPRSITEFLESFHEPLDDEFAPWWVRELYEEPDEDEDTDD